MAIEFLYQETPDAGLGFAIPYLSELGQIIETSWDYISLVNWVEQWLIKIKWNYTYKSLSIVSDI